MANAEQLAILRQGAEVWNAWWQEHPDIEEPDFQQADLRESNLQGANLGSANLQGADLQRADLTKAIFIGANLQEANLTKAILQEANLQYGVLVRADLVRANLQGADLTRATLRQAYLFRADLRGTHLKGSYLTEANFTEADLRRADLRDADLHDANFQGADLAGANFTGSHFWRTQLRGAYFMRANLASAEVGYTSFDDLDLRNVRGLETVKHTGPSTVGIDTIYRSGGNIPESFLQGCGVPDLMIEYTRSLVAAERPIDYYSVFISYSSQDEAVAQRLRADLLSKDVRCWFAPHDLKIGTPIAGGIDEAIRIYDKLLIILSEASVRSHWVAFEVSTALHQEIEQGRTMLFPIRLDDAVLHTPSGWAAQLRSRHIGDFRGWKDHDRYQEAFTRLLRDLKAKDHRRGAEMI